MKSTPRVLLAAAVVATIPFTLALADHPGPHGPPPKEATDACSSKKSGDTCSFAIGDHTLSGTCQSPPDGSALACRPDRPHGPPQEAINACSSAKQGDACKVTMPDGNSMSGTCEQGPQGGTLACRPSGGPPPR